MKTETQIKNLSLNSGHDTQKLLDTIPRYLLEDDYKLNPYRACQKTLRITRSLRKTPFFRLQVIDKLLGMHGIEIVRDKKGATAFYYANSGDTYCCTVILFPSGRFRVSSWGEIVERNMGRFHE